mmetsp:Transcript_41008/g.89603  ORF Transcript_41008/g.89603 Transcript_41008/m.89603 type:complete len:278 (-) Transcript_41008:574-1407(-)
MGRSTGAIGAWDLPPERRPAERRGCPVGDRRAGPAAAPALLPTASPRSTSRSFSLRSRRSSTRSRRSCSQTRSREPSCSWRSSLERLSAASDAPAGGLSAPCRARRPRCREPRGPGSGRQGPSVNGLASQRSASSLDCRVLRAAVRSSTSPCSLTVLRPSASALEEGQGVGESRGTLPAALSPCERSVARHVPLLKARRRRRPPAPASAGEGVQSESAALTRRDEDSTGEAAAATLLDALVTLAGAIRSWISRRSLSRRCSSKSSSSARRRFSSSFR